MLARKAIAAIGPQAWVIDDTGFKKDGIASPCVALQYSGTLGKIGNCQIRVSVHAVTDAASCPLDWRLFVPEAWDDTCADTNEQAEAISARRAKAQVPDTVRHRTKWELALEMLDELATWGHRPPLICADAGYGEITEFRLGLTEREIPYVVAVKSTTSVYPAAVVPEVMDDTGRGPRPRTIRYQQAPSSVKEIAGAPRVLHRVHLAAGHQNQSQQPAGSDEQPVHRCPGAAREPEHSPQPGRVTAGVLADRRMGPRDARTHRLLAGHSARKHATIRAGAAGEDPVAHRARLPRTETRPRPGPLRRPNLPQLAPPRHPRHRCPTLRHQPAPECRPQSPRGSLSFYETLRELQIAVIQILGHCPYCHQRAGPT